MTFAPVFTFAALTHPLGGGLVADLPVDLGPVQVGPTLGAYGYWYELDLTVQEKLLGGFLVPSASIGWEPGWFVRAEDPDGPRVWGPRPLARASLVVNLRNDHLWLYNKVAGAWRDRAFREYDPYRGAILDTEWSGSETVALMGCVSRQDERRWWVYAEYVVEAEAEWGLLQSMPRAGLLVEKLTPVITVDLDFYYSLMDTAVGGFGVLGVVWWSPAIGKMGSAADGS